mgnify:CR=1 FL=1
MNSPFEEIYKCIVVVVGSCNRVNPVIKFINAVSNVTVEGRCDLDDLYESGYRSK